jgi:acyl-CoA thioesterase II
MVGNFAIDTAVSPVGAGRYVGRVSAAWEIWGPNGGYLASLALRAAGLDSPFSRPASYFCHYVRPARFDEINIAVLTVRQGRTSCSQQVEMRQDGLPVLTAMVWSVASSDGLAHHAAAAPSVLGPEQLPTFDRAAAGFRDFAFWDNVDSRRPDSAKPTLRAEGNDPVWRSWLRLRPQATFDDPWLDAARSILFLDIQGWPAATRVHDDQVAQFVAPSLDLYVAFHESAPADSWLLADGYCPVGVDGLLGWTGRLWSTQGRLVASGTGQAFCRRLPEHTKRD